MERIGKECFRGKWFEEITLPSMVVEIQEYAFCDAKNLKNIKFSENSRLARIDGAAFWKSKIESFVAPASLREIGYGTFADCE